MRSAKSPKDGKADKESIFELKDARGDIHNATIWGSVTNKFLTYRSYSLSQTYPMTPFHALDKNVEFIVYLIKY